MVDDISDMALDYSLCRAVARVAVGTDPYCHTATVVDDGTEAPTLHGVAGCGVVIASCTSTRVAVGAPSRGGNQDRPADGRISQTGQLARSRDMWCNTCCDHGR